MPSGHGFGCQVMPLGSRRPGRDEGADADMLMPSAVQR